MAGAQEMWSFVSCNHEVLVALLALLVSCFAICQTTASLRMQREHNYRSVRPLPVLNRLNYEDRVGLELENRGLGPMLVTQTRFSSPGRETSANLVDCMPALEGGQLWATFRRGLAGSAIQPGKTVPLLLLEGDPADAAFATNLTNVRAALALLSVEIEYTDIYEHEWLLNEGLASFGS